MTKIPAGTIQIQSKGSGRLSRDLVTTDYFDYAFDKRTRKLTLLPVKKNKANGHRPLKVWLSNPERSKAGYINLAKVLRSMGIDWESLRNNSYKVKVTEKGLVIQL